MNLGFILNFIFIVLLGQYGLVDDGPNLHEDSPAYDRAYELACQVGTLNNCTWGWT